MFFVHESICISSQQTFADVDIENFKVPDGNKLLAIEPAYQDIPEKTLRRMGKAVRLGVGAALGVIKTAGNPDAIIIGTANGGMEDCIKFLNQIIEYDEGILTPTNFVQSTANAVAGQVGMSLRNKGYNITHVHRGHSFESAMLDAAMHLAERKNDSILLGAVDEISAYNYNIDELAGWFKQDTISGADIYSTGGPGSFAGEGAAMFFISNENKQGAVKLLALETVTTEDPVTVNKKFKNFLKDNGVEANPPDLYLSGENGDNRLLHFYTDCEMSLPASTPVARFKHVTGEFATASAIALWLACFILRNQFVPSHMWKSKSENTGYKKVLIYNNHKGLQHSFIICSIN
jgi:3-oxoacyl-(acyl-carrier-protein) synthase